MFNSNFEPEPINITDINTELIKKLYIAQSTEIDQIFGSFSYNTEPESNDYLKYLCAFVGKKTPDHEFQLRIYDYNNIVIYITFEFMDKHFNIINDNFFIYFSKYEKTTTNTLVLKTFYKYNYQSVDEKGSVYMEKIDIDEMYIEYSNEL